MPDIDTTLAAASAAVTGDSTPEAIHTSSRMDGRLIWGLIGTVAAAVLLAAGLACVITFLPWPATVAGERIKYLGLGLLGVIAIFGVLGLCLTGGKRVEAKAGPASVVVDS
jgi:hypothetical protein